METLQECKTAITVLNADQDQGQRNGQDCELGLSRSFMVMVTVTVSYCRGHCNLICMT